MPPKSKAQPSNPDRVTRSQRAPVPDIPLPPRREPPTRKRVLPPPPVSNGISSPAAPSRPRPVPRPITTRKKPQTSEEEDRFFMSTRAGWKQPKQPQTNQTRDPLPSPPATSAPPLSESPVPAPAPLPSPPATSAPPLSNPPVAGPVPRASPAMSVPPFPAPALPQTLLPPRPSPAPTPPASTPRPSPVPTPASTHSSPSRPSPPHSLQCDTPPQARLRQYSRNSLRQASRVSLSPCPPSPGAGMENTTFLPGLKSPITLPNPLDNLNDETDPLILSKMIGFRMDLPSPSEPPLASLSPRPDDPEESGTSGSDFSETERGKEAKRQHRREYGRPHSPTVDELEEDDLRAEVDYIQETEFRSLPQPKGRKGKAHQPDQQEEGEDGEQADDEDEDFQHRSGPLPESVKDQAYTLHKDYITAMEDLARSCGKPPKTLFRLVGDENAIPRALVPWNAYQSWYASCGEKKKPKGMPGSEWAKVVQAEYQAQIASLGEQNIDLAAVTELFRPQIEWYRERLQANVHETKKSGKFDLTIGHYAKLVTNLSVEIYQESNLILFGYLIDTTGNPNGTNSSVAWGGAPPYKELRMKKATTITQQTLDYVTMFRSLEMDKVEQTQYETVEIRKSTESKRDYYARRFANFYRKDLERILQSRRASSVKGTAIRMKWTSWTDQAFENQLTLLNWFPGKRCPGASGFKLKDVSGKDAERAVAGRDKAAEFPDDEESETVMRIVSWSDEERSLSLKNQRNIPLVIDADGKVLLKVRHSTKYKRQMGQEKPQASDDNEENEDQSESHLATKSQQQMQEEELQASNDDEQAEDQPEPPLAPFTASGGRPSRRELSPTSSGSEGEPGSHNIPAQRLPNVEVEHHPDRPTFSEDTRPRPTKRPRVNHAQSAISAPNQDVRSKSRGPGTTRRPPVIHPSSQPLHLDVPRTTNQQLPTIPHSTRRPQLDASHKRKRADLDESEQVEHSGGSMAHLGRGLQVQQPMYLHSGRPGLQVRPQVPYQHFANYPDDMYHPSHCFDAPQPRYQLPPMGPSNTDHLYYANYNRHPHYPPPADDYDYVDDENYSGLR